MPTLPNYQSDDKPLSKMQDKWGSLLNPLLNNPVTQGVLLEDTTIVAGLNQIQHKLGRAYRGWVNCGTVPTNSTITKAWQDWTPTYSAGGAMTFTGVTTRVARYSVQGPIVYLYMRSTGTTGGVASNNIQFTLPVKAAAAPNGFPATSAYQMMAADVFDVVGSIGQFVIRSDSQDNGLILKGDSSNWGLGAAREFFFNAFYEMDLTSSSVNGTELWESSSTQPDKFLNLYANGPMTTTLYVF
jgi:hypothetical protein